MEPVETIPVETRTVACDGGGSLGHPRVFLNMGQADRIGLPLLWPPLRP